MTDIAVLSVAADAGHARIIVDALVEDRQNSRWVPLGEGGTPVDDARAAVEAARCVLLVFSRHSAADPDFAALAALAAEQRLAVGVLLDDEAPPPLPGAITLYDMRGWRARPAVWQRWLGGNLYLRDLLTAARYKIANRDPPAPSAPRAMLVRQALAVVPAAFAVIALFPTLLGLWNDLGLANRPGREEQAAWDRIDPTSCPALRGFLAAHPDGKLAGVAQARLAARKTVVQQGLAQTVRTLPLYAGSGLAPPRPDRAGATANLQERVAEEAKRACSGLAEAGGARLDGADVQPGETACKTAGDGVRCAFEGKVACRLAEPREVTAESCAAPR